MHSVLPARVAGNVGYRAREETKGSDTVVFHAIENKRVLLFVYVKRRLLLPTPSPLCYRNARHI
jgi:hypothetical protein